jgi:ethanolamine ammonia-lyase small subunit
VPDRDVVSNPWSSLRRFTPAHIGLGRAGVSVPTATQLAFAVAHARARDAVHDALDIAQVRAALTALGLESLSVHSAAPDRHTYLQRPDLGRQLDVASQRALDSLGLPYRSDRFDLAFAIVDGLSSRAIHRHATVLLRGVLAGLDAGALPWTVAPVAVVEQGRVAVGDAIGEALRARLMVVLIGERPGLSAPDSLGAYVTWEPRQGRTDAERNCLSNIRPEGLTYPEATARLLALLGEARRREVSGVTLKDEHDALPGATRSVNVLLDH